MHIRFFPYAYETKVQVKPVHAFTCFFHMHTKQHVNARNSFKQTHRSIKVENLSNNCFNPIKPIVSR